MNVVQDHNRFAMLPGIPRRAGAGLLAVLMLAAPLLVDRGGAVRAVEAQAGRGPLAATLDDQEEVGVTVYNSNIALVRDVRRIRLAGGLSSLSFMDIAATVNPATVHFRSLTDPARVSVVEQNYEYDLLQPEKLFQKYVGKEVTLVRRRTENGSARDEAVRATLLAFNNGPVWKIGEEIVTGMAADHYRFAALPENLYSRPTLVWQLENRGAPAGHRIEASYLAGGMNWSADYVLTVGRDDKTGGLDGWVTLTNNSGAAYRNARLQLVAGDLNRVTQQQMRDELVRARAMPAAAAEAQFGRKAFAEYHLYTLQRRTSIFDKQTKQISLLSAPSVPVEKLYVVEGQQFYYRNAQHPGSPLKDAVKVYFKFRNDGQSGLGMPLPAGVVRVYQADSSGGLQFAGEDRIRHTPKNEDLTVHIGNAFDIVAERKQTDFRRLSDRVLEMEFEITLRNHKEIPVTVQVREPLGGDWEIVQSTHKGRKADAWAIHFDVPVEQGGEARLRYRVRVRW